MATAASPTIYRTTTNTDGTKTRTAYRVNVDYSTDTQGKPKIQELQLQNDVVAQDAGITGGGINATWTTGAKLNAGNIWSRMYRDESDTTKGWVTPDSGWEELTDRKGTFNSQVMDAGADALAKHFNTSNYGMDFGFATKAGARLNLQNALGTNQAGTGSALSGDGGARMTPRLEGADSIPGNVNTRPSYSKEMLYYPAALRNNKGQDRLKISVLKYEARKAGEGFTLADRKSFRERIIGTCVLPVPGGVGDQNSVSWGPDNMDPASMAIAGATFDALQAENPADAAKKSIEDMRTGLSGATQEVKAALAGILAKEATGVTGNILTRRTGAIVNPNMELLFNAPALRPFSFTYKLSPRSREESVMVRKIIRMFKQSMAVQRSQSQLFLKSPNTYKLQWLTGFSRQKEHDYLPKIKEVALQTFNVNYTPDGNYATYEDTSMVSYELQFGFSELEPIYNDDYTKLDGNSDESIGY